MEVEIIEKKDNIFFEREEYKATVVFEKATPSREEIKNNLITKIGKPPELLIIKKMKQHACEKKIYVEFYVYKDVLTMKKIEPLYVLKRNKIIAEENKKN
jgi:ribosomal protein S24E